MARRERILGDLLLEMRTGSGAFDRRTINALTSEAPPNRWR